MRKSPLTIDGSDLKQVWNVFHGKCHVAGPYKTKEQAVAVKNDMDRNAWREEAIMAKMEEIHALEECIKEGGNSEDVNSWRHELSLARGKLEELLKPRKK